MLLKDFKYGGLIEYFKKVSSIPRPTFAEEKIAEYICDFARERGFFFVRDEHNNVFVRMPASSGRENEEAILLQGHTDMVCEKNAGIEHDFMNEGIELYECDGFIRAKGTTLGADNGTAVAIMLYILDGAEGNIASHPTIECLFTTAEEKGLVGASAFDYSVVTATRMINMDSADESEIIVGCAGGQRSELVMPVAPVACDAPTVKITVKGLCGGHSGEDINKARANANKLMGRVLNVLSQSVDFNLVSLYGGSKHNAIPRECVSIISTDVSIDKIKSVCKDVEKDIAGELISDDCGFVLVVEPNEAPCSLAFSKEDTKKLIFILATVSDGAFKNCEGLSGIVEFSRNLGVCEIDAALDKAQIVFMSRSSKDSQIAASNFELSAYADMLGIEHVLSNSYSGWDGSPNSPLCLLYSSIYQELFGKECRVNVIHAGLECGVIKQLCPQLDIISCGAVVLNLHSPDEALNIESFEKFFSVIKTMIER